MANLGSSTWSDVNPASILLVPLGSTEQHGPHLPLDTDTRIALAVAEAASAATGATVAPALAYGSSGEHQDFAGTLSIGSNVLFHTIIELVRSASATWPIVVFVNGHGGNHPALRKAVERLNDEGHRVYAWWPSVPGGDAHAGRTETSLMLAIAPEVVRRDRVDVGNTSALIELLPRLQAEGVQALAPNGVLGDPRGASAEEGKAMLSDLVDDLVSLLQSRRLRF